MLFSLVHHFQTSSDESTARGDHNSAHSLLAKPAASTQHTVVLAYRVGFHTEYTILLSLATLTFRWPPIDREFVALDGWLCTISRQKHRRVTMEAILSTRSESDWIIAKYKALNTHIHLQF